MSRNQTQRAVPDGWRSIPLSEVALKKIVYGIVQAGPHDPDGVPYLKSSDVGGLIDTDGLQRTSPAIHAKFRRSRVVPGDIVISLRGNTGVTSVVPPTLPEANLTQGTARIAVTKEHSSAFVRQQIASTSTQRLIQAATKGSTFVEITLDDLRQVEILCPPLPEQRRIAEILHTWDRAIETVESLIVNARKQKAALMQALLTGKRHLSGYTDDAKIVPLSEISKIETGSSNKEDSLNVGEYTFFDRSVDVRRSSRYLFDTEAIIIGGEGQEFVPKYFHGKFDLHQRAYALHSFMGAECQYVFYATHHARHLLKRYAVGSTVASLRLPTFQRVSIWLPTLPEQRAIADLLRTADGEIERLEAQHSALREEKAALMQQLLIGKRRVKVAEPENA